MSTEANSRSANAVESAVTTDAISTDEARERLKYAIFQALKSQENTLIDAPTSLGKSNQIATTRWRDYPAFTGGKPVIHLHQTKDARNDALAKSKGAPGVKPVKLLGRTDACPVAAGNHDDELSAPQGLTPSEWIDWKCDVENIPFQDAHMTLDNRIDLPCGEHCDAVTQWWDVSYSGDQPEYDVIHTTANFAYVTDLIDGANVIFDEQPDYSISYNDPKRFHLQEAMTNLLQHRSDKKWAMHNLQHAITHDDQDLQAKLWNYFTEDASREWLFSQQRTDRLAPAIGRAILNSQKVCGDRYHGADDQVDVVMDANEGKIRYLQHTPDLSQARCVIGLDAHPTETRWKMNTVEDLTPVSILSPAERKWWRRNERGLTIKQLGDSTRAYTNGWKGAGKRRSQSITKLTREIHGKEFRTCIAPDAIEEDVAQQMDEAGIEEPKTMHYGEQHSRNDFSGETVGLEIGCIDPGDENILDMLALRDGIAEPVTTQDGSRETGREFEGPDADLAEQLLESVRENNLAQGAGRYARNPDDPNSGATVYVWSDALPPTLVDETIEVNYRKSTDLRESIVDELKHRPEGVRAKTPADETGAEKDTVLDFLGELRTLNQVIKSVGTGYQGGDEWQWIGDTFESYAIPNV